MDGEYLRYVGEELRIVNRSGETLATLRVGAIDGDRVRLCGKAASGCKVVRAEATPIDATPIDAAAIFGARRKLTTGVIAKALGVAPRTVVKWIDGGRIKGHRLAGSPDRRCLPSDVMEFAATAGMPLFPVVSGGR